MSTVDPTLRSAVPMAERVSHQRRSQGRDFSEAVNAEYSEQTPLEGLPTAFADSPPSLSVATTQQSSALEAMPGGMLYPWQLLAQTTLSQLGMNTRVQNDPGFGFAGNGRIEGMVAAPIQGATYLDASALSQQTSAAATLAMVAATATANVSSRAPTSTEAAVGQALAARAIWAERLQRRVEDEQGRATVWLRDYQLDSQNLASNIEEIIAFYGPERPVWRIVANGSEIWRRPSLSSEEV